MIEYRRIDCSGRRIANVTDARPENDEIPEACVTGAIRTAGALAWRAGIGQIPAGTALYARKRPQEQRHAPAGHMSLEPDGTHVHD
jgi:hypothetical protein